MVAISFYTAIAIFIALNGIRNYRQGIHAIDYLIVYFSLLGITGVLQIMIALFHQSFWILDTYQGISDPLAYNPVRNLGLLAMILLYVFAEHILRNSLHLVRFSVMISSVIIYSLVAIRFYQTGELLLMDEFFSFAQPTRLDEFAYDIIFFQAVLLTTFSFYKQYKLSVNTKYTKNIKIILFGLTIFAIGYLWEFAEHFFPIADLDFLYFSIPLFISLAVVYFLDPKFIYYTPHDIYFLQISTVNGNLIYSAEFQDTKTSADFFLTFSITGINSMLTEALKSTKETIQMKRIILNDGELVFEQIDDLILTVYVEKLSKLLRRSLQYFMRQFKIEFADYLTKSSETQVYEKISDPIYTLYQCIPTLTSKIIRPT